jgi:hypothetical protein
VAPEVGRKRSAVNVQGQAPENEGFIGRRIDFSSAHASASPISENRLTK